MNAPTSLRKYHAVCLLGVVVSVLATFASVGPVAAATRTFASAGTATAATPTRELGVSPLDGYIAGVARAWEPYTTTDGRVEDPLNSADTGDNYGVILLADVMLKVAHRTGDNALELDGTRIIASALTLPVPNDPFNLLAIAAVIHDGEQGNFPSAAWERIATPLIQRVGEIGPPLEVTCLTEPLCYDNWHLVWSAGAALLLSDHANGTPDSVAYNSASTTAQIGADLKMALLHAGAPLAMELANENTSVRPKHNASDSKHKLSTEPGVIAGPAAGGAARELSDPGAEPPAYELFSAFMLELIGESDPQAFTVPLTRLRDQSDRYALDMMAPDGQLSLSGRSLDQSWVQAAAAALGARRAALEPANSDIWNTYAERAVSYLLSAYPLRANGLLPIVPGLSVEWNQSIMDGYAALNQYEGLTLWLLSDALERWPQTEVSTSLLPADNRELVANDLGSSGLVWGRSGNVWWQLSGRTTSNDPRSDQGLVAIKVDGLDGWRDLLALRPRQAGPSSVWSLELPHHRSATPTFTDVKGTGRRVTLIGAYRLPNGRQARRTAWTLATTTSGVKLSMSLPAKTALHTTVWLANLYSPRLSAPGATVMHKQCLVTASGGACPVEISWRHRKMATLEISE